MTNCPRAGKLFGCKFTGRFETVPPSPEMVAELRGELPVVFTADIIAASAKAYVRDVCQRCGKTVERVKA